jgi:hypothetical protein
MPNRALPTSLIFAAQVLAWLAAPLPVRAAETYQLSGPRQVGELARIKVSMQATGQLFLQTEGKKSALDMSVAGQFEYDERITAITGSQPTAVKALRDYTLAEAKIKLEKGGETPSLRPDRRLVSVQVDAKSTTLASVDGVLSREELDLIDLPANSLLLDELLPPEAISTGAHWKHSDTLVSRFLNLEAVSFAEAESTLAAVEGQLAKLTIAGAAQGAVGGIVADLEFRGKYEVNLASHRVIWLALLIKDKRPIGHVNPGMDVVAKILVERSVLTADSAPELATSNKTLSAPDPQPQLLFEPAGGGYSLTYDRRWFVTTADRELAVLRLLDRGELLAQCNISPLPAMRNSVAKSISLEDFQAHVKDALGKRFGQFVQASQIEAKDGQEGQVYRVVVQGEQAGLSLRWIYYLVLGSQNERLSLAFTMEEKLVDRFGDADRELVAGLQARPTQTPTAAKPLEQR